MYELAYFYCKITKKAFSVFCVAYKNKQADIFNRDIKYDILLLKFLNGCHTNN